MSISHTDFTKEEHKRFTRRYEDGYDFKGDPRYDLWKEWKEGGKYGCIPLKSMMYINSINLRPNIILLCSYFLAYYHCAVGMQSSTSPSHVRKFLMTTVTNQQLESLLKRKSESRMGKGKRNK